jgi:hypothetical protein
MKTLWKKTRIVVLTCLIILLALPLQSFAADGPSVSFKQVSGQTGDVVEIPVKLNYPKDLIAYGLELNFDKAAIELAGVKDTYGSKDENSCANGQTGCIWYSYQNENGMVRVAWADPTAGDHPLNKSVVLFTLQFSIKNAKLLNENTLFIPGGNKEALTFVDISNKELPVKVEKGIASSNANLSGLTASEGKLAFSKDTLKYALTVKHAVQSISFIATTEDLLAKIKMNGKSVLSGTASAQLALKVGTNEFQIEVTAEDGAKKVYVVTVTRGAEEPTTGGGDEGSDGDQPDENTTPVDGANPDDKNPPGDDSNPKDPKDEGTNPDSDEIDTTVPDNGDEDPKGDLPRTGDDSYIDTYLNIGIFLLSGLFVFMWIKTKRRRKGIEH